MKTFLTKTAPAPDGSTIEFHQMCMEEITPIRTLLEDGKRGNPFQLKVTITFMPTPGERRREKADVQTTVPQT